MFWIFKIYIHVTLLQVIIVYVTTFQHMLILLFNIFCFVVCLTESFLMRDSDSQPW
jgi:hypothetical protein